MSTWQQQLAIFNQYIDTQLTNVESGIITAADGYDNIINFENAFLQNPATQAEIDETEANANTTADE
jgi:hypothetical protein